MTLTNLNKAPFPWFGGKSKAADAVWSLLGDVPHYIEPFFGSGAVLLNRPHPANRPYVSETVNDADGFVCLAPHTRVLSADLAWRRIGDLLPGDRLIAFDEHNGAARPGLRAPESYRKFRVATVLASRFVLKPCWRLTFSDGTQSDASADHQWLGGSHRQGGRGWRWIRTGDPDGGLRSGLVARETQSSWVMKVCDVVEPGTDHSAGWVGGFLDGEGNVKPPSGWSVNCTQKTGAESDRYEKALRNAGIGLTVSARPRRESHHSDQVSMVTGTKADVLRLLMWSRPERLIRNLVHRITERSLYGRSHEAVSLVRKEFVGVREVVAVETDTHTFIAEGLASHNCNFWRAVQWYPVETAEAASWPVTEADKQARQIALLRWRDEAVDRLAGDAVWCDPVMAGWWAWAVSVQIGAFDGRGPWTADPATGRIFKQPPAPTREPGVARNLPHLTGNGRGVNRPGAREPGVLDTPGPWHGRSALDHTDWGDGYHPLVMPELVRWFRHLAARLRHVRVLNGDWSRLVTTGAAHTIPVRMGDDPAGVFLDPPYADTADRANGLYAAEDITVAHDVREWCLTVGGDPRWRIVLAGFDGEHGTALTDAGWSEHEWFTAGHLTGGMGQQGADGHQQHRERLWASPHCLTGPDPHQQMGLFDHPTEPAKDTL